MLFLILIILLLIIQFFVIAILSVDIPYFAYYNARISNVVLNWSEDFSIMFKTVFLESYYLPYLVMFFIFYGLSCFFIIWIARKTLYNIKSNSPLLINISVIIAVGILLFFGARGETNFSKKPLSIESAYFSDYSFPNQLGINPIYNFVTSFKNQRVSTMSNQEAMERVKISLNRKGVSDYPIASEIKFSRQPTVKPNVIIVIVESLCTYILRKETDGVKIMPFLDSLSNYSITFENIYSAGIHTYNGLYSILCGLPSILNIKPLTDPLSSSLKYSGISSILKKYNYNTVFICSGDKTFDNMNSFTLQNDFDKIISKENYPDSCLNTFWGASDNFLFDRSLQEFDELSYNNNTPFLGVILTSTSHEANTIPQNVPFQPKTKDYYEQLFEFTDWSISHFIEKARKRGWYNNTIFVFVGDHGQRFDPTYDMSLTYHHIPMIFFWEKRISPRLYEDIGLQVDLTPTLMGLLKLNYINNTLGIDLRTEKRPFAFFTADDKIGVLNKEFFLVIRTEGPTTLYKYKLKDVTNYLNGYPQVVDSMQTYAYSMLQVTQWLIEKKKTNLPLLPQ
ncbi:MAG: LTA synthase family protein [Ignavibacteria bacterium]